MGVEGLYKFINKNFPEIYKTISIHDLKGKSCIIDGIQHIYSQLIYMRSRDNEIINSNGKNISHIHGLINSLTYYLKNGVIPIFIFDGKTPEIKKKKIEERKKNLEENLQKLKNLEEQQNNINEYINIINNEDEIIYGTPPLENNIEQQLYKINNIQEEYKKIYKKTIIMKNYYIKDWIEILELLGVPVLKAIGEADPLCAYININNPYIYGIISDDSDMLVFGTSILMRKTINQQFSTIKLKNLLYKIENLLSIEYKKNIKFDLENLIEFSILLGTDYGKFKLNKILFDSLDILKYYVSNNKNYKDLISIDQYDIFENIKKYYINKDFEINYTEYLQKPIWKKPDFLQLKKRLLELNVDEDYIDKNNKFLYLCYSKIVIGKNFYNEELAKNNNLICRFRSNSFRSNSFGSNSFGSNSFGSNSFRSNNFRSNSFRSNSFDNSKSFYFSNPFIKKLTKKNNIFYNIDDKSSSNSVEDNLSVKLDDVIICNISN